MKRIAATTILMGVLGMVIPAPEARAQVSVSVSIGAFYDELSPYGEWVDCTYGECWVPRGIGAGWQPYTNGEWIYTRYGWTWVSSDPWGASPYHYGTWDFEDRYGWVWVPGTVWAPAWVTWSYSDSYVGWAPMPPRVAFGRNGYSGRPVVVNEAQYVFVPTNRFVGTNVTSVRVESRRNAEIFRQAKPVTRFEVSGGVVRNVAVPMATVQRAMGHRIETREIGTAHTTPRTVSSGGVGRSGQVAIVAPARDVKAARASWQVAAAPHAAKPPQQAQPQSQQAQTQPQQPQPKAKQQHQPKAQAQRPPPPQQQPKVQPQQVQPQPQQPQPQHQPPQQQQQQQPKVKPQQVQPPQQPKVQPQQVQPQHQPPPQQQQPQQQPKVKPQQGQQGHEKAMPAGEEQGKDQNKGKKD